MAADLRLQPRRKPFPQTGSPFDATNTAQIKSRPGVQDTMPIDVDVGAFSYSRKTEKMSPTNFMKRGSGTVVSCLH